MYDSKCISNGIVAGVVAGIVLAFFIILGGMTEALGSLTKTSSMIVHFIVSIIAGLFFALVLGHFVRSWWTAIFWGLFFGIFMWLIGPMTLLPTLQTNAPLFSKWNHAGIQENLPSLLSILVYGLVLGLSYCFLKKGKLHKLKKPKS